MGHGVGVVRGRGGAAARLGAGRALGVGAAAAALHELQRRLALVRVPARRGRVRLLLALARAPWRPDLPILR